MGTEVNVKNSGALNASFFIAIFLIVGFLIGGLIFTLSRYKEIKTSLEIANTDKETLMKELKVIKGDVALLGDSLELMKTKNKDQAYKIRSLTLTKKQLQEFATEDAKTISNLKIKLKDVQSVSTTSISNQVTANTSLEWQKDSTWTFDTEQKDTLNRVFGAVSGIPKLAIKNVKIEVNSESFASLAIINYQENRRFLFWKWQKSTEDYAITTNNPSVKITGFRVIKMSKE